MGWEHEFEKFANDLGINGDWANMDMGKKEPIDCGELVEIDGEYVPAE